MNKLQRKTFQHAGLTLSYLDNEQPSADVPIVLLHGFTASAAINWVDSGWMSALTDAGRRVIAIDARGHGDSDKPHDSRYYPSHIMMADSLALLELLGFQQADFAGFSMGARMATFAAIYHPETVRKLLIGGLGLGLKTGIGHGEPIAKALRASSIAAIAHREARRFRLFAEKGHNDLEALACCITASREPITDERLRQISAQTLILVGEADTMGGDPHAIQPLITNSCAKTIPNCTHFDALTHQDFRAAGLAFLVGE